MITGGHSRNLLLLALALSAVVHARSGIEYDENGLVKRPTAGFIPLMWPPIIGIVLYGMSAALMWCHWFRMGRQRYLLTATIGMTTMVIGFVIRIIYVNSAYSIGIYSITTLLVLLSPCAYLALQYMMITRLAASLGEEITSHCLLIRSSRVVKIFVTSDVVVFLFQAAGGGLSAAGGDASKIGDKVGLIGLIIQVISYGLFSILLVAFAIRVRKNYPEHWNATHSEGLRAFNLWSKAPVRDWRILFGVMCAVSVAIMIRCVFRVAEFAGGYDSVLATSEGWFWLLDALPLWLGMSLYCFLWPARCIGGHESAAHHMQVSGSGSDVEMEQPHFNNYRSKNWN